LYKLSNYTNYRQLFVLVATIVLNAGTYLGYKLNNNASILMLVVILSVSVLFNIISSVLYDVSVIDKKLNVSNLYRKGKIFDGEDFVEISNATKFYLIIFYTSPPFYVVKLKNGEKYMFLNNSIQAYFSVFSFDRSNYASKFTEVVKQKLNQ
jgi:hypothetical protein